MSFSEEACADHQKTTSSRRSPSSIVEFAGEAESSRGSDLFASSERGDPQYVMEQGCRSTFHRYLMRLANAVDADIRSRVEYLFEREGRVEYNETGIRQDARFLTMVYVDRIVSNINRWKPVSEFARRDEGVVLLMQTALFIASKMCDPVGASSAKLINRARWKEMIECETILMAAMNYDLAVEPPCVAAHDAIRACMPEGSEEKVVLLFRVSEVILESFVRNYPLSERVLRPGWHATLGAELGRALVRDFASLETFCVSREWVKTFWELQSISIPKVTRAIYDQTKKQTPPQGDDSRSERRKSRKRCRVDSLFCEEKFHQACVGESEAWFGGEESGV